MSYERHDQPPIPRRHFARRLVQQGKYGLLIIGVSLAVGIAGYHWIAGFTWVDSLLNASMLLGGMGPVGELSTTSAKLFASVFALYSGVVFLIVAGLMLPPIFHRVLHRFHWESQHEDRAAHKK